MTQEVSEIKGKWKKVIEKKAQNNEQVNGNRR